MIAALEGLGVITIVAVIVVVLAMILLDTARALRRPPTVTG